MKRILFFTISALALTVIAEPLFAAESETAAPREQQAERAPARQRAARPARQPTRQTSQTSQNSQSVQQTWTGGQAGGFGGGNVGGAGFADPPVCPGHMGETFSNPSFTPACQNLDQKAPQTGSATGGGTIGYGFAVPLPASYGLLRGIYLGAEAMVSANRVKQTYTLNQAYPGEFAACCQELTRDTRTATTQIGSSFSALARLGVIVTDKWLVYFSGGSATAKVDSTFTQTTVATINFPTTTTVLTGTTSVSKTVTGAAYGGGVEFAYLPGVKIRLQYLHAQFPDVTFVTPVGVAVCQAPAVGGTCTGGVQYNTVKPQFNQFTVGVNFGL